MIVYRQAFDLYHTAFRMLSILSYFKRSDYLEVDRLRIWDFYFLYPNKVKKITLKRNEKDIKELIWRLIDREENPYEELKNDRIFFEKIKPYQIIALKCLASYGVINKDFLQTGRISLRSNDEVKKYLKETEALSIQQSNALKLLTSHFYLMPLEGENGLKKRTKLIENKYNA